MSGAASALMGLSPARDGAKVRRTGAFVPQYSKLRPYLNNWLFPNFRGIALGDFWVFESKESHPTFNYYVIQTRRYQKVANLSTGTKMPRSDWKTVSKTMFQVPLINEQTKIGNFLLQLDVTITLHHRKLDALKILKQGYLENMFPQKGENVPKMRFANFSGDWEQRKLEDVGSRFNGLSGKTKKDFGHGNAEYITYVNVFNNPITKEKGTEKIGIDNKQNQVQYGDVFFTVSSETPEEVGLSSVWTGSKPNIYLNSFCFGFRPEQIFHPYFLAFMLRAPKFRKNIIFLAQGISRYNISKNKVMNLNIFIPDLKEQNKIGEFLKNINKLIAYHENKLSKLKDLKKAYLQNLFI